MMLLRWMLVALAYGAILYAPLFFVAFTGLVPVLPAWSAPVSALVGFLLGSLGPLRHLDWIARDE